MERNINKIDVKLFIECLLFIFLITVIVTITIRTIMTDEAAGGIVYKKSNNGNIVYLLVTTSKGDKWIFPKGKLKSGELKEDAALREVNEESGVIANIKFSLDSNPFTYHKSLLRNQNVNLFAMEYVRENEWKEKKKRKRKWMSYKAAVSVLTPEFSQALKKVHSRLINANN